MVLAVARVREQPQQGIAQKEKVEPTNEINVQLHNSYHTLKRKNPSRHLLAGFSRDT